MVVVEAPSVLVGGLTENEDSADVIRPVASAAHALVCERPSVELGGELADANDEGEAEEVETEDVRRIDAQPYARTIADAGCTALGVTRLLADIVEGCS